MTRSGTTRTTRRSMRAAVVAGVLVAGLAGCGSDDGASTSASGATTSGSGSTAATTAPAPTATDRADAGKTATADDVTPDGTATGTTPTSATVTEAAPAATTPTTATTTPTTPTSPSAKAPRVPTSSSGSAADQAAVRQTVGRYMRAFVRGDGRTACALLSDKQRRLLGTRGAGDCAQAVETAHAAVATDARLRGALEGLRVGDVAVTGDRAVGSARVKLGGRSNAFPIELERTAGGWRISSNSPAGG